MQNPKRYRKLSEPFGSHEACVKATDAFQDELAALREKHKIPDLLFVAQVSWDEGDGNGESTAMLIGQFGNVMNQEAMAAYALGVLQQSRQELMASYLGGALKHKKES